MTITDTWQAIADWCAANAPATSAEITAPASLEERSAAQRSTQLVWPGDVEEWFSLQNGIWSARNESAIIPPLYNPRSVSLIVEDYFKRLESARQSPPIAGTLAEQEAQPAGTISPIWLSSFLPIAVSATGEDLYVDLRSGPLSGCVCEHCEDGFTEPLWNGVQQMLDVVLSAMTDGIVVDDFFIRPSDGYVVWEFE